MDMTLNKHLKIILLIIGIMGINDAMLSFPPQTILFGWAGLMAGIIILILALRNLTYAFTIWLLVIPFCPMDANLDNMLDLGVANLSPERLVFFVFNAIFFTAIFFRKIRLLPISYLEITMLGFSAILLASLYVHDNIERYHVGVVTAKFLAPMMAFFIAKNVFRNDHDKAVFMWALFGLGAYLGATAFFEFFRIESWFFTSFIADPAIGSFADRARGPFLQAAQNGTAMGMLFFISIYLYARTQSSFLKTAIVGTGCMILLGVFFSLTRGAWIGTALGLVAVASLHHSFKKLLIPGTLIALVSLPILLPLVKSQRSEEAIADRATNMDNVYYRFNTWLSGLNMFVENPIFGVGVTRFVEFNYFYQNDEIISKAGGVQLSGGDAAHNTYIEVASELGLVGLIPYLVIMFSLLSSSVKLYRSLSSGDSNAKNFIAVFWGAALTYFASSFFVSQNSLFLSSLLFALGGIVNRRFVLLGTKSPPLFGAVKSSQHSAFPAASMHPAALVRPRSY
jgi:O-antigen ligase